MIKDVPDEQRELIITPARIRLVTRLPGALLLTNITKSTVPILNTNASAVIPAEFMLRMIAKDAPRAAPEDAPRKSGEAIGFWKIP